MHVSQVQFHWFKRQNSYFLDKKLKILALVRSPQTAYCGLNHGLRFLRDFTHGKITEVPSHYTQSLPIRNTRIRNDPSTSSIRKRQPIEFFDHEKQIVILTTRVVTVYEPWNPIQFMTSNWSYFEFSHHILQQYLLCLNIFCDYLVSNIRNVSFL